MLQTYIAKCESLQGLYLLNSSYLKNFEVPPISSTTLLAISFSEITKISLDCPNLCKLSDLNDMQKVSISSLRLRRLKVSLSKDFTSFSLCVPNLVHLDISGNFDQVLKP